MRYLDAGRLQSLPDDLEPRVRDLARDNDRIGVHPVDYLRRFHERSVDLDPTDVLPAKQDVVVEKSDNYAVVRCRLPDEFAPVRAVPEPSAVHEHARDVLAPLEAGAVDRVEDRREQSIA